MIKISFIIPTIPKRTLYLRRLLTTIDNIGWPGNEFEKELIIVDEGKSAGAQRNIGLKRCTGDYLYFVDDDDLILRNFMCGRMQTFMRNNERGIFFVSERWIQPNETDLKDLRNEHISWAVGRRYKTYKELFRSISNTFNPYNVGCYVFRADLKHIQWPEAYEFGEDIGYNRLACNEISKTNSNIAFIDECKHIVVRHDKTTTWQNRDMRWHQK